MPNKRVEERSGLDSFLVEGDTVSLITMDATSRNPPSHVMPEQTIFVSESGSFELVDVSGGNLPREEFKDYLEKLAVEHGLHETSVKDCLAPSHLPKIEHFHDVFFILTRYIDDNAPDEGSTVQELTNKVAMFVSKKTVLSIHRRLCPFIDKLKLNWDSKYSKSSI